MAGSDFNIPNYRDFHGEEEGHEREVLEPLYPIVELYAVLAQYELSKLMLCAERLEDPNERALLQRTQCFGADIQHLRYQEGRYLRGILESIRWAKPPLAETLSMFSRNEHLSPNVIAILEALLDVRRGAKSVSNAIFLNDAIFMSKFFNVFGVNMINPDLDPTLPSSLSVHDRVGLHFRQGPPINVEPCHDRAASEVRYIGTSKWLNPKSEPVEKIYLLEEGKGAAIASMGVNLSLFGVNFWERSKKQIFNMPTLDCELKPDRNQPLAINGLLVIRHNERIFLFDKGSKDEITITSKPQKPFVGGMRTILKKAIGIFPLVKREVPPCSPITTKYVPIPVLQQSKHVVSFGASERIES